MMSASGSEVNWRGQRKSVENTFSAAVKLVSEGKQINFDGVKVSPRELKITRSDDKNTTAHLFLRGDGMLVGSWTQVGLLSFTNLNAVIKVE